MEGLSGIIKVTRGFKGSREVNKGYDDPNVIGLEQIVAALKATGT